MPIALRHLARRRGRGLLGCEDGPPKGCRRYESPMGSRMALPRETAIPKPWQHWQGGTSSCVGHGVAHALCNGIARHQSGRIVLPSPLALYKLAQLRHGDVKRDEGTYMSSAADSLWADGFCTQQHWPWRPVTRLYSLPSRSALGLARVRKGIRVRWVTSSGDAKLRDMQMAIAAGDCVVIGRAIDRDYSRGVDTLDECIPAPDPAQALGGHCTCLRGYRTTRSGLEFLDENSWRGWGVDGDAYLSESHVAGVRQALVIETRGIP